MVKTINPWHRECYYCLCRVCSRAYCPHKKIRCENDCVPNKRRLLDCDYFMHRERPHYMIKNRRKKNTSEYGNLESAVREMYRKIMGCEMSVRRSDETCGHCACMSCEHRGEPCHDSACRQCANPAADYVRLCVLKYDRTFGSMRQYKQNNKKI